MDSNISQLSSYFCCNRVLANWHQSNIEAIICQTCNGRNNFKPQNNGENVYSRHIDYSENVSDFGNDFKSSPSLPYHNSNESFFTQNQDFNDQHDLEDSKYSEPSLFSNENNDSSDSLHWWERELFDNSSGLYTSSSSVIY